ncbi:MAG: MFS transporter [Acidimicrobiia bacterium]
MRTVIHHSVDDDGLRLLRTPRDDVMVERVAAGDRFVLERGPFRHYERDLTIAPGDVAPTAETGGVSPHQVTETIRWRLAIPVFAWVFVLPVRRALRRRPEPGHRPVWAPPDVLDARAATVLGLMCAASLVAGYLSTLVSQTITFAADEFSGANRGASQGATLAVIRLGVAITLVAGVLADRRGRRRWLIGCATAGVAFAAAGAAAPSMAWLGTSQILSRGFGGALGVLIVIVAAEEMPKGSRAYALGLLAMSTALGAGMCLWALPLADLGERGWRLVYLVPLVYLPLIAFIARRLPETRRFVRAHVQVKLAGHGRRLGLLAATGLLINLFVAPASQLQNEYLRTDRGFSASRITLFTILTAAPGGLGILIGGRAADVRGRRRAAVIGLAGGATLSALQFASSGLTMWTVTLTGVMVAAYGAPALQVFQPEFFPTALRGRAAGLVQVAALAGSAVGLVGAGILVDRWGSFAGPMMLLAIGPVIAAVIIHRGFPETARLELEELNPEDAAPPPLASPPAGAVPEPAVTGVRAPTGPGPSPGRSRLRGRRGA